MINTRQALTALREANPAVDEHGLSHATWSASDLLLEVARRTDMQTQQPTELKAARPAPPPKEGRGPLIAMASAAAVLVIGALFALTSLGGDSVEPEPATTSPPETTVAPSTTQPPPPTTVATVEEVLDAISEEGLSVATAFIDALLVGDLATAETYALDSVALYLVDGGGVQGVGPSGELPWKNALGWDATLNECIITTPGPDATRVQCSVTNSTDISRALGVDPYTSLHRYTVMYEGGTYFGQTISDTTIVSHGGDANTWEKIGYVEFKAEVFDPFMAWLQANHREDLEQVMWHAFDIGVFSPDRWLTGDFGPSHTPESVELWRQHSEEFIAEQVR